MTHRFYRDPARRARFDRAHSTRVSGAVDTLCVVAVPSPIDREIEHQSRTGVSPAALGCR
jgi:hypothetical protein